MFITGLGEVKGMNKKTKIFFSGVLLRVADCDDQKLSLIVPALFNGDPLSGYVDDNKSLRRRLKRLNPDLDRKFG